MKRTFEGRLEFGHKSMPIQGEYFLKKESCDGDVVPLICELSKALEEIGVNRGKQVRVSIEVEPVTLRSRVEKIFDDWTRRCGTTMPRMSISMVRDEVLAEIEAK